MPNTTRSAKDRGRIAYQGEAGANSHLAAAEAFPALEAVAYPTFEDALAAVKTGDALYAMIGEEMKHRTTDEWLDLLQRNDIPCMRPHTLETLLEDPHLADTGFFRFEDHPSEGRIRTMREPSTWSETAPPTGRFAPRLGQHTREILAEAGFDSDAIDTLIATRTVMTDSRK